MHILFVMSGWTDEGGGTVLPRAQAKALARRGHQVTVLHGSSGTGEEQDGVRQLSVPHLPVFSEALTDPLIDVENPKVRRIAALAGSTLKPDVVHIHAFSGFSLAMADELGRAGAACVYTSHNYWPLCPRMYLFKADLTVCEGPSEDGGRCAACTGRPDTKEAHAVRLRKARSVFERSIDLHLAVSERARKIFIRNGHDPERIEVLPPQPPSVDSIWRDLGSTRRPAPLRDRPLRVGFIGNLYAWKGAHVLIDALQAFEPGGIEAHLFGGGADGYASMLRSRDEKGLARFHGRYRPEQLTRILEPIDVVVVPSVCEETGGLVVLEALAARLPVVGSRIGGIPELIREGETGFLFSPGDSAELASVLHRFITDPGLLLRMQSAIARPKGFERHVDDLLRSYRNVLQRK